MLLQTRVPGVLAPSATAAAESAHFSRSWAAICSNCCIASGGRGPISAAITSARTVASSATLGSF